MCAARRAGCPGDLMDRIVITGGQRLQGVIPISGAKNSAIKLMAEFLAPEIGMTP